MKLIVIRILDKFESNAMILKWCIKCNLRIKIKKRKTKKKKKRKRNHLINENFLTKKRT